MGILTQKSFTAIYSFDDAEAGIVTNTVCPKQGTSQNLEALDAEVSFEPGVTNDIKMSLVICDMREKCALGYLDSEAEELGEIAFQLFDDESDRRLAPKPRVLVALASFSPEEDLESALFLERHPSVMHKLVGSVLHIVKKATGFDDVAFAYAGVSNGTYLEKHDFEPYPHLYNACRKAGMAVFIARNGIMENGLYWIAYQTD